MKLVLLSLLGFIELKVCSLITGYTNCCFRLREHKLIYLYLSVIFVNEMHFHLEECILSQYLITEIIPKKNIDGYENKCSAGNKLL